MEKKECTGVTGNMEISYLNTELLDDMKNSYYMENGLKPSGWKVDKFEYDEKNNVTSAIIKPIFDFDKALLKTSRDK